MFKILSIVLLSAFAALSQQNPRVAPSSIETGYMPYGFDSNDHVQFVIEGTYRDTCSKPAGTQFKVNPATKTIQIQSYEYRYTGPCLDILVPHDEVISVGILNPGVYQVLQGSGRLVGRLNVTMATKSSPDDYLYAPVSQAYVKNLNGKMVLTISGTFTNSCMRLENVISQVHDNVITVQPLAQVIPTYVNCVQGSFPFEKSVVVEPARIGRYLLHVRSLNGNAINTLVDFK